MLAPAGLLRASALVLGVTPGLASRADRAAERFQDREAYAAHVLQEQEPEARALEPSGPKPKHVLASVAAVAGAVVIAAASLFRRRLGRAARAAAVPMNALAALHSGHVGEYVA